MAVRREQVVQTAEKLVARGKIEAAIREYRKVLSEHPNDATTLNRVGDLYARIERFEEAVRFFTQIAENYTRDGFFVKAIAIYKKIIKLDPTRLEVYERLAELYHRQGLVNEARTQYQVLADYYVKHDNRASALSIYERMAQLEPDNPSPRVKLAELYQEQQLTDKAMGEYRTIAELMISRGHPEQAAQVYERALDVDSDDLVFIGDAVAALRRANHAAAAAHLLATAVRRNPEAKKLARQPAPEPEPDVDTAVAELPDAAAPSLTAPVAAAPPAPAPPEPVATVAEPEPEAEVELEPDLGAGEVEEFVLDLDADELEGLTREDAAAEAARASAAATAPAEPGPGEEIDLDLEEVFTLDFDADEAPASLVVPPADMVAEGAPAEAGAEDEGAELEVAPLPDLDEVEFGWAAAPPSTAPAGEVEIDAEFLEQTAAELQPRRTRHEDDLFTEAEVLAKYSLDDKAVERLHEVLKLNPRHLDAMALLIRIDLDKERFGHVVAVANEMAAAAAARHQPEAWEKVRARLAAAGFAFEGDRVVAAPSAVPDQSEASIGRLIEDLLGDAPPARRRPAAPPAAGDRVDRAIAEIADGVRAPKRKRGPSPPPAAAAPPPPPPPPAPAESAAPLAAEGLEDSGVAWLDDVAAPHAGAPAPVADGVFTEEDDFFDLAAELEQELSAEEEAGIESDILQAPHEQTLEEIVEGFKRGVAESLSAQDYDTHFNLGIAYREMGLLDEAIGEFQLAAKAPDRLVECCSMLGLCFLDKGLPELAVKWYKRGLAAPGLSEDDTQGLLYDLGNVYLATGDLETAYATFVDVYGTNSNYRDVVAKLEEISSRRR
jgi:tetratricopeptide (TPR) repeat protein